MPFAAYLKRHIFYLLNKISGAFFVQTIYYKKLNNYIDLKLTNKGVRDRISINKKELIPAYGLCENAAVFSLLFYVPARLGL